MPPSSRLSSSGGECKNLHVVHNCSLFFHNWTTLSSFKVLIFFLLLSLLSSTKHADSIDLELEVDPLNVDHFSCTPLVSFLNFLNPIKINQIINCVAFRSTNLFCASNPNVLKLSDFSSFLVAYSRLFSLQMWACALGHLEAAVVLYKWDRRALAIPDSLGRLPLSIARSRGHTKLAECLEQLQREEQQPPAPLPPTSHMSFSPAPDAPTTDSWMVSWPNNSVVTPSGKKGGPSSTTTTSSTTSLNPGECTCLTSALSSSHMCHNFLLTYRQNRFKWWKH